MSLADEYRRQTAWREWGTILDALPPLRDRVVLDLGCAVGEQAARLAARGARVIGVDGNEDFLREARARGIPGVRFLAGDLRTPPFPGAPVDGIWCSFAAAYFPDPAPVLAAWAGFLRPGGWIALTEVDDLFGHEPLPARAAELLGGYARDAFAAGRYDFHMGGKLDAHLARAGFTVVKTLAVPDREFSFSGPVLLEVLDAWRRRFDRMKLLRDFCGAEWDSVRDGFLASLASPDHRSGCRVVFCHATRPG